MAELVLKTCDRFSLAYDILAMLGESSSGASGLAEKFGVSEALVSAMVSNMVSDGLLKAGVRAGELRLTAQGFSFVEEFAGIRKFLG